MESAPLPLSRLYFHSGPARLYTGYGSRRIPHINLLIHVRLSQPPALQDTDLLRAEHVSGAENGAERAEYRLVERSGERAKSAAQNTPHHKITQSKKLKIDFKSYHETVSVNSLLLCLLC